MNRAEFIFPEADQKGSVACPTIYSLLLFILKEILFLLQVVEATLAEGLGICLRYCSPVQLQCIALAILGGYWSAVPFGCCLKAF